MCYVKQGRQHRHVAVSQVTFGLSLTRFTRGFASRARFARPLVKRARFTRGDSLLTRAREATPLD